MIWKLLHILNFKIADLLEDRSGATMVEYGLMVATVGVAILITFISLGETIRDDVFLAISNAMQSGSSNASQP